MRHATLIPQPLRDILIEAAMLTDDAQRREAIDRVTASIKLIHPELFHPEPAPMPARGAQ